MPHFCVWPYPFDLICYSHIFYSIALFLFETALFVLTLISFLIALCSGGGAPHRLSLMVHGPSSSYSVRRPWRFVLTFRSPYPVTLYINVSFVGEGRPS
jgi:hypothetical protein